MSFYHYLFVSDNVDVRNAAEVLLVVAAVVVFVVELKWRSLFSSGIVKLSMVGPAAHPSLVSKGQASALIKPAPPYTGSDQVCRN